MRRSRWTLAVAFAAMLVAAIGAAARPSAVIPGSLSPPQYVAGSTHELCRLTGYPETQTHTGFGLQAGDHGYSFSYQNRTWFLFGDSQASLTYRHHANRHNRWPDDPSAWTNDSIAWAQANNRADGCPKLAFPRQAGGPSQAQGAFANPHVLMSNRGGPGHEVSLRTNEAPVAGISANNAMSVVFKTNNPVHCANCTAGHWGESFSSVVGVLTNAHTLHFRYLYTLSGPQAIPAPGALTGCPTPGRFVEDALADDGDGYVYVFGTAGGAPYKGCTLAGLPSHDHSDAYLARIPLAQFTRPSRTGPPAGIEYFAGLQPSGFGGYLPRWSPRSAGETAAAPVFSGSGPCMGSLGVEYNTYVRSWVMLYNCHGRIDMTSAPAPWGPWTAPQLIFDPVRDKGFCYFIYHKTCPAGTPDPPPSCATRSCHVGAVYGPFFVAGWTAGHPAAGVGSKAGSTFFYTLDTFVPYGQVIVSSQIQSTQLAQPPPCVSLQCQP